MDYANLAILIVIAAAAFISGRWFWRRTTPDDDCVLDHVAVKANDREEWQMRKRKLGEAAAKYGKPFRAGPCDIPHEQAHRQEPRSRDLQELDATSKREREAAKLETQINNITKIERKAK